MNIDKKQILFVTEKLDKDLNSIIESNKVENEAAIYLIQNMDKIKYILTAYPCYFQYQAVIKHIKRNFKNIDKKSIDKILFKNGIFKLHWFMLVDIIITTLIFGAIISYYFNWIINHGVGFFILFVPGVIIAWLIFACIIEYIMSYILKNIRFYRLSSEYKKLKKPTKKIWDIN